MLEFKINDAVILYNIENEKDEKYVSILGFKEGFECTSLIIPEEIEGYKVKEIASEAFTSEQIEYIAFPNNLVTIGNNAFECSDIKEVVFPDSLQIIESGAFANCSSLTTVKFNEGLREIEDGAFSCTYIETINLPNSLTKINRGVFEDCELESVTFGPNIKTIDERAFALNARLKYINFSEGLESIGSEAFFSCAAESIELPNSLVSMDFDAFNECPFLKRFYIGANFENNDYMETLLLLCMSLENITVHPDNKQFKIIDECLYDMKYKELVKVPSNMYKLTIPKWVQSITAECFYPISPDIIVIRKNNLDGLTFSGMENAKLIVCPPGSEIGKWASKNDVDVEFSSSLIGDFIKSLSDESLEVNN